MSKPVNMVIRDAVMEDVQSCVAIDHHYETDRVWQMQVRQDDGWQIVFHNERLPRTLEGVHASDEARLLLATAPEHCFLVASEKESGRLLGYLVMQRDLMPQVGVIVDIAVEQAVRRCGIGKRLLGIAAIWAKEHSVTRIQAAIQTTNYPAINFLQGLGFTFCGFNDLYFPNRDIAVFFSQPVR